MKRNITEYFLQKPTLFWSLMACLLIAGVLAFIQMPKLEDPAIYIKQAMVIVPYPGATAHEVELEVAQVMEDELRTIPNIKKITSDCQKGMASITIELLPTVLAKDIEQHFDLLRRKVSAAQNKLPQGCYTPIVIDDMMDVYGMFYSFTGEDYEPSEMYRYAKYIRRELLNIKGVKRVNIYGNREEVINITIPKENLSRNGIVPTNIMTAINNDSKTIDAGTYQDGDDKIQLRVSNQVKDEDDIRNMLIQTLDGKQIRLGDVAIVEREYVSPQRNGFFVDGKPSLAIFLSAENDVNVTNVGKLVDQRLAELAPNIPVGMNMDKIFFQPDKVNEAIDSFMINLVESVLIVIISLIFAMGLRSGLIIGIGLILTIAGSFPILLMCGTTLQRISLGAFIIAMGMLVDNAIVIMDGILVDKERKKGPKTYLYSIVKKTAMPLLGATIIAVATFLSVFLSKDTSGEYARDLFIVLCVSLLFSWVLAMIQVPIFAKYMMPARITKSKTQQQMNSPMHRVVRKTITVLINYKKTTISIAVICLVASVIGMGKIKNLFFPDFNYKQFIVEYYLPSQTDPDKVKDDLIEISTLLKENPTIERVAASMGSTPARYCLVRSMTNGGDYYGELMVDCSDYNTVVEQVPIIRDQLRKAYPDAYIRVRKYNFSVATTHTIEVEFRGPDPTVLRQLSDKTEAIMRNSPYTDPHSVKNNWNPKGKSLIAEYTPNNALRSGIGRGGIGNALSAATDGMTIGVINDKDIMLPIRLQVRNADGSKIKDLNDIPVWSMMNIKLDNDDISSFIKGGKNVDEIQDNMFKSTPLSNVTRTINLDWEEERIQRVDGERSIEVECDPNYDIYEATPAKVKASIEDEIEAIELPNGYSMRWAGEIALQEESTVGLYKYIPITSFIVLLVLLLLFNNWKKTILILMCFPFVICGITPALLLCKSPFTFMAIIGVMGLMGMMIKNAIVLVDEINRLVVEEHQLPYDAVINATVSRTRPVIMASLTTILGMLPLVTDPMYESMAVTIMSGLAVGTIITLALLPLFYSAFFHIKKPINKKEPV